MNDCDLNKLQDIERRVRTKPAPKPHRPPQPPLIKVMNRIAVAVENMSLTDFDQKKLAEIESKLPFHYDSHPTITKEEISFLISRLNRICQDEAGRAK